MQELFLKIIRHFEITHLKLITLIKNTFKYSQSCSLNNYILLSSFQTSFDTSFQPNFLLVHDSSSVKFAPIPLTFRLVLIARRQTFDTLAGPTGGHPPLRKSVLSGILPANSSSRINGRRAPVTRFHRFPTGTGVALHRPSESPFN